MSDECMSAKRLNLDLMKDRYLGDLDRNVDLFFLVVAAACFHDTAGLSCRLICSHTNTEQCVHVKNGALEGMMEAGREVLMHDCVSVRSKQ